MSVWKTLKNVLIKSEIYLALNPFQNKILFDWISTLECVELKKFDFPGGQQVVRVNAFGFWLEISCGLSCWRISESLTSKLFGKIIKFVNFWRFKSKLIPKALEKLRRDVFLTAMPKRIYRPFSWIEFLMKNRRQKVTKTAWNSMNKNFSSILKTFFFIFYS